VYAVTTVHPRGNSDAYNIVLVDLDVGFRMMSSVIGDGPVVIGARVEVRWREAEDDEDAPPVPVFAVVGA
jgi:uncharacterized OB-fold protein